MAYKRNSLGVARTGLNYPIKIMNKKQIARIWRKLFARATAHDGYQPYGYDLRTLQITQPALMKARARLQKLYKEAKN